MPRYLVSLGQQSLGVQALGELGQLVDRTVDHLGDPGERLVRVVIEAVEQPALTRLEIKSRTICEACVHVMPVLSGG